MDHLKDLLLQVKSDHRFYLIIDGLDDSWSGEELEHRTVMALIKEAKELNDWFIENDVPFKILILCRTDMFDQMSDPNKNKIKSDDAYVLNWFSEAEADDYSQSRLVQLANLRTKLVYPGIKDVFNEFFPKQIKNKNIRRFLLDHTRHTPRDFIQLLTFIQNSCREKKVSHADITRGIKKYSLDYFKGEIRDELSGKITTEEINHIFSLITSLGLTKFRADDLKEEAKKREETQNLDLQRILPHLFECNAIGNIKKEKDKTKYYFKFRNPEIQLDFSKDITLHKGLWKALVT